MAFPALFRTGSPFDWLTDEMSPFFGPQSSRRRIGQLPAVNLYTNNEGAVLTAEVPGVDPDQIDVSVQNDTVTIRGNREPERGEDEEYIRRERQYGNFVRTITLPYQVDPEQVAAKCRNGILQLQLPRAEEAKPHKVKVEQSE